MICKRKLSNWDLRAVLVAVGEWQGVWPDIAGSGPSKSIVEEHRGEWSIALEVDFDVVANPMTIDPRGWWGSFVGAWCILLLFKGSAEPESQLSTITTLDIDSEWKFEPWEFAGFSVVLGLSDKSEITSFL